MYNYNLYTTANPHPMFVVSDVNLLEMYKAALITGAKHIMWEKGILDLNQVIGIMDMTPTPYNPDSK